MKIRLAIDAMGGDASPRMIIQGVALAQKNFPDVVYSLYGDQSKINPLLEEFQLNQKHLNIIHTDEVITDDMKPSAAIRGSKNSSMRLAIDAVAKGESNAVVSAG